MGYLCRRVLHIVFPHSYSGVLLVAGLDTLEHRMSWLCDKYMKRITINSSHPLSSKCAPAPHKKYMSIFPESREKRHPLLQGQEELNLKRTKEFYIFQIPINKPIDLCTR